MPHRLPPGCVEDVDRHGNIRIYLRRKGSRKVRLHGTPWTPAFMAEYDIARQIAAPVAQGVLTRPTLPNTWSWLVLSYFDECSDFKRLDPITQIARRHALEATFDEPLRPGSDKRFADVPLARMTANAVEILRDRKLATPQSANARLKDIRQVFKWAVAKRHVPINPAREVPYLKTVSEGHHTWTEEEITQFEQHHPIGTKARLALALLYCTGQRRSDVIRFGKQHVKNGKLTFTQHKGRNHKPHSMKLDILPELQDIIDASPCGDLTFLVNKFGRPYSAVGFSNQMRDWCDQAGLPKHCTAHGLRKAGATIATNKGATTRQLMAMFGWDTIKQAEHYTRKSDQERLAEQGMPLLSRRSKS
jgi:site-specific recombinase XerD